MLSVCVQCLLLFDYLLMLNICIVFICFLSLKWGLERLEKLQRLYANLSMLMDKLDRLQIYQQSMQSLVFLISVCIFIHALNQVSFVRRVNCSI